MWLAGSIEGEKMTYMYSLMRCVLYLVSISWIACYLFTENSESIKTH